MQIPCARNNVFGVHYYHKKYSNKNNQNRQHLNLASTQKYKKFIKIVWIHGILPKDDTKIRKMNIINNGFLAKKQKIQMGTRSGIKINKIEKKIHHKLTICNTQLKK